MLLIWVVNWLVNPEITNVKFNFAKKNNMKLFFTSAADGTNVVKVSPN